MHLLCHILAKNRPIITGFLSLHHGARTHAPNATRREGKGLIVKVRKHNHPKELKVDAMIKSRKEDLEVADTPLGGTTTKDAGPLASPHSSY
jgi:hypothetical protein